MDECFRCGATGDKTLLFDAISEKGIVKICKRCSFEEDIPIIRRKTQYVYREPGKEEATVRERLSKLAGINNKEHIPKERRELLRKQEVSLREIVDRNFEEKIKIEAKPREDLVDNFHWVIMRVRRSKKITQAQLAGAIGESVAAVRMAEQGVVPKDDILLNKIENHLSINLRKNRPPAGPPVDYREEVISRIEKRPQEIIFDDETTKTLTISDLQDMKKKKESEIFETVEEEIIFNEDNFDDVSDERPEFVKKKDDLSQDEIDDLIFGRK